MKKIDITEEMEMNISSDDAETNKKFVSYDYVRGRMKKAEEKLREQVIFK